jgi:hypothetical protein
MKKKSTSQSAFFNLRILTASVFCLLGIAVALFAQGKVTKQTQQINRSITRQDAPGTQRPDVVQMVGPVRTTTDVRHLPYVPNEGEIEERRLTRHQFPGTGPLPSAPAPPSSPWMQKLLKNIFRSAPLMPPPLLTFDGMNSTQTACGCLPPDTDGDVGPNHYVEALNVAYRVYDKSGNPLTDPITFNTLFQDLVGTPCSGSNSGDPFVLYDHLADRWLISDFAFSDLINGPFYQCIAVSTSPDPAGTYNLYAIQHEPAHMDWIGDYPKFALWSDPQPGGAYHFTVNLFDLSPFISFNGVRVFALDRASMLAGGPTNAIAFTIGLAGVGDSYSLVPAYFRTGDPPPAGRDEMLLAVDATFPGVTLTQVHGWLFHVDFVTPGNSTIGLGADHTPNAEITVNPFVQAWTATTYNLVPQDEDVTTQKLDTLGDKIMTPLVYQNRNGTESLWADQTTMLNFPNGPTAVSWYQFDVTGGNFPATPVQQQEWTNDGDGLWRWMASIAVDADGNTAIGYSTSNTDQFASIRYAGRLESDPPGNLAQGEAIMTNGGGAQTHSAGRWGDYTYLSIDPSNGMDFWHVNEYYTATSSANWATKIGKFNFVGGPTPTPTATATPSVTPTVTPTPGRPSPTPRPRPTPHPRP